MFVWVYVVCFVLFCVAVVFVYVCLCGVFLRDEQNIDINAYNIHVHTHKKLFETKHVVWQCSSSNFERTSF